jgi:hypothetical protein
VPGKFDRKTAWESLSLLLDVERALDDDDGCCGGGDDDDNDGGGGDDDDIDEFVLS